MITIQERLIRFLTTGLKMTEEKRPGGKYRKFVGKHTTLWVKKNGTVRSGKTILESIKLTSTVTVNMRMWETKTSQPV